MMMAMMMVMMMIMMMMMMMMMFMEARDWTHGVHFLCVAFQNKVAYAIGGSTLHSACDLPIGGSSNARKLAHQDINEYSRKTNTCDGYSSMNAS